MARDELGMDIDRAREVIRAAEVDKAREYANALLDDLALCRRELADRITGSPFARGHGPGPSPAELASPVPIWASAVAALRKLAERPAILALDDPGYPVALDRAADWLAAIGPDTTKLPCEACLKPTTMSCSRCGRRLCAPHAALNTRNGTHDHGRLICVY